MQIFKPGVDNGLSLVAHNLEFVAVHTENALEQRHMRGENIRTKNGIFFFHLLRKINHFTLCIKNNYNNNEYLVVNDEYYDKIKGTNNYYDVYFDSTNASKLQDDIDKILKDERYHIDNKEEYVRIMRNLILLIGIFLYGFITVITLISVTNIFNTITTSMELRKPEFAMLKSVGMTTKEFNRMIRLESIFVCIKSLIFGIPIGLAISYVIYLLLSQNEDLKFEIPFNGIIISSIFVLLLISILMKYSISKINKQNMIETIRNENI